MAIHLDHNFLPEKRSVVFTNIIPVTFDGGEDIYLYFEAGTENLKVTYNLFVL